MTGTAAGQGWERFFWLLFTQSSNPIVLLDESRKFVEINKPALELLGRSRGEVVGTSIVELIKPEQRAESAAGWEELLRTGEYEASRGFVRPDGTEIALAFAARIAVVGSRRLAVYVILPQANSWTIPPGPKSKEKGLTAREREIVTLIAMGRETSEIGKELHISPETVRTHVRNAMGKLNVHTRAELVAVVLCDEAAMDLTRLG